MGGERGCSAAESNFFLAVETAAALDADGERTNIRKPKASRTASISVIGFVRRIARDNAIVIRPRGFLARSLVAGSFESSVGAVDRPHKTMLREILPYTVTSETGNVSESGNKIVL